MPGAISEKNTMNNAELVKKSSMSYAEALDVIQVCDAAIKNAAANRIPHPGEAGGMVQTRNMAKTFSASLVVFASMGATDILNILDASVAAPIAFFGMLVVAVGGIRLSCTERGNKALSPLKYNAINHKLQGDMALFALKEQEFAAVEVKVLKKAKKAMKIINKNVSFDNREICYSNVLGKEGFDIVQTKQLSAIESEKLRLQKMDMDSLKELQQFPNMKALDTGTMAGISSRS